MKRNSVYALLALAVFVLPVLACGGSNAAAPTRTPVPTWTPTAEAPAPTAAPVDPTPAPSPWAAIVAAYVGPDASPSDAELRQSFTAIMTAANEIVMAPGASAEDVDRAQAIFDAAAGAHDALAVGDGDALAMRWRSLDTFVALLRNLLQ